MNQSQKAAGEDDGKKIQDQAHQDLPIHPSLPHQMALERQQLSVLKNQWSQRKGLVINSQVHTHLRGGCVPVKGTVASQKNLYKLHFYPSPFRDLSPPSQWLRDLSNWIHNSNTETLSQSIFLHIKPMWNWSTAGSNCIKLYIGKNQEPLDLYFTQPK